MLLSACLLAAVLASHPGSLSRSEVVVTDTDVLHGFRFQALTLIETLELDLDGNLLIDERELEQGRPELEAYLAEHYLFFPDTGDAPLAGEIARFDLLLEGQEFLPQSYWIEIERRFPLAQPIESLRVRETLFEDSNPQHIEYLSVAWEGQTTVDLVFQYEVQEEVFVPSGEVRKGPLRAFVELGVDHILTGYDHLLFLLALLAAVRGFRSLAWVITAFTLAHSITLALAALDVVALPGRFVEIAIALSIVYVAVENLLALEKRSLWLEALVFGLLHGLGFAGFLGDALRFEDDLLVPLVGFNLGVELGQLLFVIPLALVFLLAQRARSAAPAPGKEGPGKDGAGQLLVPRRVGQALSVLIACAGLYWFAERSFFG